MSSSPIYIRLSHAVCGAYNPNSSRYYTVIILHELIWLLRGGFPDYHAGKNCQENKFNVNDMHGSGPGAKPHDSESVDQVE